MAVVVVGSDICATLRFGPCPTGTGIGPPRPASGRATGAAHPAGGRERRPAVTTGYPVVEVSIASASVLPLCAISILRALARSATGMITVTTPFS